MVALEALFHGGLRELPGIGRYSACLGGPVLTCNADSPMNLQASAPPSPARSRMGLVLTVVLLAGGFVLFRRAWPVVGMAWHDAIVCAQVVEKTK